MIASIDCSIKLVLRHRSSPFDVSLHCTIFPRGLLRTDARWLCYVCLLEDALFGVTKFIALDGYL